MELILLILMAIFYTPRGSNQFSFYRYSIAANSWETLSNIPERMNDDVDATTDGTYYYLSRQQNTTDFWRYDPSTDGWTTLASAPLSSRYAGAQYVESTDLIYFFRGNGDYRFWKYNPDTDEFLGPSEAPSTLATGSDMVYHDEYFYVPRGANGQIFYRFDPSANNWTELENAPERFNDDVKGEAVGDYLYFFRGSNTLSFYRYHPTSNTWSTLADAPATVRFGASLVYPGTGDYLYATRGATTSTFWRYHIPTDTWLTDASDIPDNVRASYGSRLISDGTDIFFTAGIGIKRMFKYTVATGLWTELAALPYSPYYGSDISYANGKILALAGYYTPDLYEYTISSNSWKKLDSLDTYGPNDVGTYNGASIAYDPVGESYYVTRGYGQAELLNYTPGSTTYPITGTWTSPAYDLEYVESWSGISIGQETPGNTTLLFQSRSSNDGLVWSEWEEITDDNIASPANKFLQLKVTFSSSSDHELTPVVRDISFNYVGDQSPPAAPENFLGFSRQISGESLTSESSYRFTNPYFTWDAALDEQTAVQGYYVYFGQNEDANPEEDGFFQLNTNFQVNQTLETGTYYLKVASQDLAGHTSSTTTGFIYDYRGISPALTSTFSETGDFLGEVDSININNNYLQLSNNSEGFWLEERLTFPPASIQYAGKNAAYLAEEGKLYVLRGANNATFYEYDVSADTWSTLADAPGAVRFGGGVVEGPPGYLYAARGNNSTDFWRYDIEANTWDADIASAPLTISYGGSLVFDGEQYIYVLRGNNSNNFWRYDTFSDEWQTLSSVQFGAPSDSINDYAHISADITIDRENQLIYATAGNLRHGFSVYDINTDAWTVLPDTPTLAYFGSALEYDSNTEAVYYTAGYYSHHFFKYDVGAQEWIQLSSSPDRFYYGGGLTLVDDYLLAFRGENNTGFYKYDIAKDSWLVPNRGLFGRVFETNSVFTTNYGADIVMGDGDNFYLTRGNYADQFVRWNQTTGAITKLANTPAGLHNGAGLVYDNNQNKIYLTGGTYNQKFYVYDITSNVWSEETADPTPLVTGYGSSMVYDGERYIYLNRGSHTTSFYRFDTQGESGAKWETLTNAPAGLGYGAKLLFRDDLIYTMRGQNVANNPLYFYDTNTESWNTTLSPMLSPIYNDAFLVDGNEGHFYLARAHNTSEFYRYSLTGDSWQQLADIPAQLYAGASAESNLENKIFVLTGSGTNSYSDALYTYVMETEDSAFVEEGSYISQTHDLGGVYRWAGLEVTQTTPSNTSLNIETRTSVDGETWSDWAGVTQGKELADNQYSYRINSQANRYIQIKFEFSSSDGVSSPRVEDYTINYFQDLDPPSNPQDEGLSIYSQEEEGELLVSNVWYNHSSPYFEWPEPEESYGASDTAIGSGVAGYYVYFGSDELADPAEDGQFQVDNNFEASSLEDGEIYYLLIKTSDEAGNINENIWDPFVYKYDARDPSAPENLTADPSGYTAFNNFNFSWDAVIPAGADIVAYCYKTGASEGEYASDQCIESTTVEGIPSYKVGVNTFYVRAKDQAGNYSAYANINYFYADISAAPAPPQNLQVEPETSTNNLFSFTWDEPMSGTFLGSASNLSYHYSVNALPTAFSTSTTSLKYLNPGAYATLPGENILYVATKDEASNINYSNYAQVSFFANTVAPGIPLDVEIADVSVKSTSSWRLAISWDEPTDAGSGVDNYQVYRSFDGENFDFHSSSGGTSFVDTRLTQKTHYYQIKACDNTNNCGAFSDTVSLYPDGRYTTAAELVSGPTVTDITTKKAIVSWATARTSDSRVAFGTSSGEYAETEVSSSEHVSNHSLELDNLSPGTTYFYVTRWVDEDGNRGESEEATFSTLPPPSTMEPVAKSVGLDSALIEFTSKNASKIRLYYGESSAFGGLKEIATGTAETVHTVELDGLTDGTKYYFKINAVDIDGTEYEGEIHAFETLPRPEVSDVEITQVVGTAQTTLLLRWTANTEVSSIVTYFPSDRPDLARDEVNIALKSGRHRMILYNLEPQRAYTIIIRGTDVAGNEAISEPQLITTASDTRPPQVLDLNVESEIIGEGEEARAQLIVTFKTDEPASSQVEYGEGTGTSYSQKTQEDGSLKTNHLIVISGLTPAKIYHLRAIAKDEAGNLGESLDKVVVTPKATENALDLVLNNLQFAFGFLNRN